MIRIIIRIPDNKYNNDLMVKKSWTPEDEQYLKENYPIKPSIDLCKPLIRTDKAIRSRAKLLGLVKVGDLARRPWTFQEDQYMRDHYPDDLGNDIAQVLGRSISSVHGRASILGLSKSESFKLSDFSCRLNGTQGGKTRFKKGHMPANKGKKMPPEQYEKCKRTMFKKGNIPENHQPVGTITERNNYKRKSCYLYIKIAETNKWIPLHHFNWINAGRDISEGTNLVFKDGNFRNCDLNNLKLITNQENMNRNTIHRYPEELKKTILTLGHLKRKIREHEE